MRCRFATFCGSHRAAHHVSLFGPRVGQEQSSWDISLAGLMRWKEQHAGVGFEEVGSGVLRARVLRRLGVCVCFGVLCKRARQRERGGQEEGRKKAGGRASERGWAWVRLLG